MNEEITDVRPPMGFPHITDLAGSEATILQVANSQGDILGYATLDDIDAYIEQKVSETVHSFSQKQTFQDVTINGTIGGSGFESALAIYEKIRDYDGDTSVDANTITAQGIYRFRATYTGTATNLPTWQKTGGAVLDVHNMGTYCIQRFYPYGDDTTVYIRKKSYGSGAPNYKWSSWEKLATESNTVKVIKKSTSQSSGSVTVTLENYGVYEFMGSHEVGGIANYLITTYNSKMQVVDKSTSQYISHSQSGMNITFNFTYSSCYSLVKLN